MNCFGKLVDALWRGNLGAQQVTLRCQSLEKGIAREFRNFGSQNIFFQLDFAQVLHK
jgi:hypothetical protein